MASRYEQSQKVKKRKGHKGQGDKRGKERRPATKRLTDRQAELAEAHYGALDEYGYSVIQCPRETSFTVWYQVLFRVARIKGFSAAASGRIAWTYPADESPLLCLARRYGYFLVKEWSYSHKWHTDKRAALRERFAWYVERFPELANHIVAFAGFQNYGEQSESFPIEEKPGGGYYVLSGPPC